MGKKKGHRSGRSLVGSVEKLGTGVAFLAPAAAILMQDGMTSQGAKSLVWAYGGYNIDSKKFEPHGLLVGWGGLVGFTVARVAAHKIIGLIRRM